MKSSGKGAVLYKSKYGATRQYAEWISQRLGLPAIDLESIHPAQLISYDFLIIGSSVYMGKTLIKDWMKVHKTVLRNKKLFLFVVSATPSSEREKQQQIVQDNVPEGLVPADHIFFLPGRLQIGQLSRIDRLILKMGMRLEKDKDKREVMAHGVDEVKKEHIAGIVDCVAAVLKPVLF